MNEEKIQKTIDLVSKKVVLTGALTLILSGAFLVHNSFYKPAKCAIIENSINQARIGYKKANSQNNERMKSIYENQINASMQNWKKCNCETQKNKMIYDAYILPNSKLEETTYNF